MARPVNGILHREHWDTPLRVDPKLHFMYDKQLEETDLFSTYVVKAAWNHRIENPYMITQNMVVRLFTQLPVDESDERIFHTLTSKKRKLLRDSDITFGEIMFIMQRYADVLMAHSFNSPGNTIGLRFSVFSEIIVAARTLLPEYSAMAWTSIMRKSGIDSLSAIERLTEISESGYTFDDFVPYFAVNYFNTSNIIHGLKYDIDPHMFNTLNNQLA